MATNKETPKTNANLEEAKEKLEAAAKAAVAETEKKPWYKKMGTGLKIGLGVAAAAVVAGAGILIAGLLGKHDDEGTDEPTETTETTEE